MRHPSIPAYGTPLPVSRRLLAARANHHHDEPVRAFADQLHDNYLAALRAVTASAPGAAAEEHAGWLCIDAGPGFEPSNVAAALTDTGGVSVPLDWFASRGCSGGLLVRHPDHRKSERLARLRGFAVAREEPAMVRQAGDVPGASDGVLDVRPIDTLALERWLAVEPQAPDDIAARALLLHSAMARAPIALFLGLAHGVPVARAMLLGEGELLGLYNLYVHPSHRRRRYGSAMTAAALRNAADSGARAVGLVSTPMARDLYRRLGFETVYHYRVYGP